MISFILITIINPSHRWQCISLLLGSLRVSRFRSRRYFRKHKTPAPGQAISCNPGNDSDYLKRCVAETNDRSRRNRESAGGHHGERDEDSDRGLNMIHSTTLSLISRRPFIITQPAPPHSLFTNGPTWVFPAFCIFANVSNIDHTVNGMTAIMQSSMAT